MIAPLRRGGTHFATIAQYLPSNRAQPLRVEGVIARERLHFDRRVLKGERVWGGRSFDVEIRVDLRQHGSR
jgi:hypothetical protein